MHFTIGERYLGEVIEIKPYGAVLKFSDESTYLLHISNIADEFVQDVSKYVSIGDTCEVLAIPGKVKAIELTRRNVDIDKLIEEEANQDFDTLLERYLPKPDGRDRKIHRKYNKDKRCIIKNTSKI